METQNNQMQIERNPNLKTNLEDYINQTRTIVKGKVKSIAKAFTNPKFDGLYLFSTIPPAIVASVAAVSSLWEFPINNLAIIGSQLGYCAFATYMAAKCSLNDDSEPYFVRVSEEYNKELDKYVDNLVSSGNLSKEQADLFNSEMTKKHLFGERIQDEVISNKSKNIEDRIQGLEDRLKKKIDANRIKRAYEKMDTSSLDDIYKHTWLVKMNIIPEIMSESSSHGGSDAKILIKPLDILDDMLVLGYFPKQMKRKLYTTLIKNRLGQLVAEYPWVDYFDTSLHRKAEDVRKNKGIKEIQY